jgi:diketogulonate reductase-like aldo/keto reductase
MSTFHSISLHNLHKIPLIGLGVYQSNPGSETYGAVLSALAAGYRHIDTAQIYRNEADVGKAIVDSGIPRSEIFLTTKVWISNFGYDQTLASVSESLRKLQTSYIDLLLLHAPGPDAALRGKSWSALQHLQSNGQVRSIGVSNFGVAHLEALQRDPSCNSVVPCVNQIELHPWCQRTELVRHCESQGIVLQAYSPLAKAARLDDDELITIGKRRGMSPAQVLIAWSLSKGFVTLPKSVTPERIIENMESIHKKLEDDDIALLDTLEEYFVTGWDPIKEHIV